MKRRPNKKGFTIVELVIVIALIAILATTLVPTFGDVINKAQESAAKQAAKNAYTSYMVEHVAEGNGYQYFLYQHNGRYVTVENGAATGVYDTKEEALTAMIGANFDANELADSGDGKLFIYGGEVTQPSQPTEPSQPQSEQLFDAGKATKEMFLDKDGVEKLSATNAGNTWYITDYMPVDNKGTFLYSYLNAPGDAPYSAFYDANKNLVSVFKQKQGVETLEIPDGAAYVRFSVLQTNGVFNFHFWRTGPEQLFVKENAKKDYLNADGTTTESAYGSNVWYHTDYMPVDSTSAFFYSILGAAGDAPKTVFYDAEKNVVGSYQQVQGKHIPLEIPDGAAYVRFSVLQVDGNFSFYFLRFESAYSICINGDSIETESAGLWSKMLRDNVIFSGYKNIAVGGTRIKGQINGDDRVNQIPVNTDILITAGGTNDWAQDITLGSMETLDDPETFYGAVHLYIQKVQEKRPNTTIVMASNPFGVSCDRFMDSQDPSKGIYNNINLSIADYAQAIQDVAEHNGVYYVPIYEECGINAENYSLYLQHEFNNKIEKYVDLHPNADGAQKILNVYLEYLDEIAKEINQ